MLKKKEKEKEKAEVEPGKPEAHAGLLLWG